jgi:hypothetical protein
VGPVGSAGEPEDRAGFEAFSAEGATVYLARELCDPIGQDGARLRVRMPGYGDAVFRFESRGLDKETNH